MRDHFETCHVVTEYRNRFTGKSLVSFKNVNAALKWRRTTAILSVLYKIIQFPRFVVSTPSESDERSFVKRKQLFKGKSVQDPLG